MDEPELVEPSDDFKRVTELIDIVDGDTLKLKIDQGWNSYLVENVRLARCDTPEAFSYPEMPAGKWVTEQLTQLIRDNREVKIQSLEFNPDRYRRCVVEAWVDGINISQWLLDFKLAWQTDDEGRVIGKRDIDLLLIPDEIRRQVREYKKD